MLQDQRPMAIDANRAFMLWTNTKTPIADAVERVCADKDPSYKSTVLVLCQLKYLGT